MTSVIIIQETALSFVPNVNFTHLFIAITFFLVGLPKTLLVVFSYTLIDNLIMGSLNLAYGLPITIMWLLYPCMLEIASRMSKNRRIVPAIVSSIHSLIYSWAFVFVFTVFYHVPFKAYLIADLPYEAILILTAFLTNFLFLPKLVKTLEPILKRKTTREECCIEDLKE